MLIWAAKNPLHRAHVVDADCRAVNVISASNEAGGQPNETRLVFQINCQEHSI